MPRRTIPVSGLPGLALKTIFPAVRVCCTDQPEMFCACCPLGALMPLVISRALKPPVTERAAPNSGLLRTVATLAQDVVSVESGAGHGSRLWPGARALCQSGLLQTETQSPVGASVSIQISVSVSGASSCVARTRRTRKLHARGCAVTLLQRRVHAHPHK